MKYQIMIAKQAQKKLIALPVDQKSRIAERIYWLGENPDNELLDIKKLVGRSGYRLRVGDWRILFEKDDEIRIISIEAIKARGDAYK